MRATVVVPTYRRPELLARCLAALAGQTLDPSEFEIVVADDAAGVDTRRQVERFAGAVAARVRYLPVPGPRHGPAAARNLGWRAAAGEVIAFTDDDCVPDPGWLAAGLAALDDGADAATGRVVVPRADPPTDYERNEAGLETAEFVTANLFVRRARLAAFGGFDERFTAAWREDSDLHFTLLRQGARIVQAGGALVRHPVRPAPWGVSLRQQSKSRFNALLYRKDPPRYRRHIQAGPPWRSYATLGALGLALIAAVLGDRDLAGCALGLWVLLTLEFCGRRLRGASRSPAHVAEMVVTSALIPPLSVYWRLRGAWQFRVLFF